MRYKSQVKKMKELTVVSALNCSPKSKALRANMMVAAKPSDRKDYGGSAAGREQQSGTGFHYSPHENTPGFFSEVNSARGSAQAFS